MDVQPILRSVLAECRVSVRFGHDAMNDLLSFDKSIQETLLALICARAMRDPLFKPNGIAESLHGDLHGFSKIKPKHLGLRIVYRPVQKDRQTGMEIVAIGLRDREKVYRQAALRVAKFTEEMFHRSE